MIYFDYNKYFTKTINIVSKILNYNSWFRRGSNPDLRKIITSNRLFRLLENLRKRFKRQKFKSKSKYSFEVQLKLSLCEEFSHSNFYFSWNNLKINPCVPTVVKLSIWNEIFMALQQIKRIFERNADWI